LRLHVQLDGAFPPVWRRVEVASDRGLADLHGVLQVVFGWEDYHLYRFTAGPEQDPGAAFVCTADLAEAWDDDPVMPTWDVRVDELLAAAGERLYYGYDYGDNWWLTFEVADWWGDEPAPDAIGLVPFDPATVGDRLQALELAARCPDAASLHGAARHGR